MNTSLWRRRALAALVVVLGVASNLASNFVGADVCDGADPTFTIDGDGQTGAATAPLGASLGVTGTCRGRTTGQALPLYDLQVEWTVSSGGGLVNGKASTVTQARLGGRAAVNWQLGSAIGPQTVTARALGRTLNFQAVAGGPAGGGTCVGGAGTSLEPERVIVGDERWPLAGSPYRGVAVRLQQGATLTVEPGVTVCIRQLTASSASRIQVLGEPDRPVTLQSIDPGGFWEMQLNIGTDLDSRGGLLDPGVPHRLRGVRSTNLAGFGGGGPLAVEDSRFTMLRSGVTSRLCAGLLFNVGSGPQGGTLDRVVFQGYGGEAASCFPGVRVFAVGPPPSAPLPLRVRVLDAPGDALAIGGSNPGSLALTDCEIARAGRHGVVVLVEGAAAPALGRISGCNITDQLGQAVQVEAAAGGTAPVLDARGNWWGATGGPPPSGGNAVTARVDAGAPAAAPFMLAY